MVVNFKINQQEYTSKLALVSIAVELVELHFSFEISFFFYFFYQFNLVKYQLIQVYWCLFEVMPDSLELNLCA